MVCKSQTGPKMTELWRIENYQLLQLMELMDVAHTTNKQIQKKSKNKTNNTVWFQCELVFEVLMCKFVCIWGFEGKSWCEPMRQFAILVLPLLCPPFSISSRIFQTSPVSGPPSYATTLKSWWILFCLNAHNHRCWLYLLESLHWLNKNDKVKT